jgi:hypothetical protein
MWTHLLGPILALLPERWRRALFADAPVNWARAAFLSGLIEGVGCLLALIGWYLFFLNRVVAEQMDVTLQATKGVPAEGAAFGMGAAALSTFALHPLTWALAYFWIEGVLRALAAWTSDEVAGTLPLVLADRAVTFGKRRAYEKRVPLVADVVSAGTEKDPWALRVESCRPKPTWKPPLTVRYRDEYFQVAGEGAGGGSAARPHVYLLRRPAPGEVYRGMENYDPEEIVREAEEAPRFWGAVTVALREKIRIAQLPLVADRILRGDGSEGWHLRVESCRPKPMWTPPRTIRFEDQLYTVEGSYETNPPRPFGYTLHRLRPHEAARGLLNYSPDEVLRKKRSWHGR